MPGVVWDAIVGAGRAYGVRPTGLLALDVARIEAGLLLIDVDFFSARRALTAAQYYTPLEMGFDRLVDFHKEQFVGRSRCSAPEARRAVPRRIVGLSIDWTDVEALYTAVGLPPLAVATRHAWPVPVFAGSRQVGPHDVVHMVAGTQADDWTCDDRDTLSRAWGQRSRLSTRWMWCAIVCARQVTEMPFLGRRERRVGTNGYDEGLRTGTTMGTPKVRGACQRGRPIPVNPIDR
jgi:hypothetical protein